MTTKVSFCGGLDEIEGNKILLEDKGINILIMSGYIFLSKASATFPMVV